jgi:hypothetical protein
MLPNEKVVKAGSFLYDDSVVCDVQIRHSPVRYGSGDYEDPPELAEDQQIDCFNVYYGSTTERGQFSAGGGSFESLEEAVRHVEQTVHGLTWLKDEAIQP